jgi:DNA invertase Pin-like site-specific DNA recombinase
MTYNQKQSIKEMRSSGLGYKKIAEALDLFLGTVKSFCRRENITATEPTVYNESHCRQWADRFRLF